MIWTRTIKIPFPFRLWMVFLQNKCITYFLIPKCSWVLWSWYWIGRLGFEFPNLFSWISWMKYAIIVFMTRLTTVIAWKMRVFFRVWATMISIMIVIDWSGWLVWVSWPFKPFTTIISIVLSGSTTVSWLGRISQLIWYYNTMTGRFLKTVYFKF